MADEKTPVVWDDTTKKHRPLGTGEKMGGLDASSLLSSDSGNLLETGSDGLAYLSGSGIADPRADNLLETSSNGKLQVTADRLAEWLDGHPEAAGALVASLADGETIVASGGKLVVDPTTAPKAKLSKISAALRKAGAGLSVDSGTGKLVVDFASMDPAIMRAVVLSMVQQGGGIGVDSNGQLYVDFDSMPTDKFEDMLKSLKMLVPLTANKTLYVSTNNSAAGDTIIDGRGTQAKPFKTIQACVNYATGTFAMGSYHITIRVVAGTYGESVTLPDFSRGTGFIVVMPDSGARDVIVQAPQNASGTTLWCFQATGGDWRLYYMDARREEHATTEKNPAVGCYAVLNGGVLQLYGCAARQAMPTGVSVLGGENYTVRLFSADVGGTLRFMHGTLEGVISAQKPSSGGPQVACLYSAHNGTVSLTYAYDDLASPATTGVIACAGSCDIFFQARQAGGLNTVNSGTLVSFTGTMTGKRYSLTGGSYAAGLPSDTYFPGDVAGGADASTYSWYEVL